MVATLLRKTRKEILRQKGKLFSSMLLVFLAIFSFVAFSSMMPTMRSSLDATYEEYGFPDLMVVAYSVPRSHISEIGDIDGVERFALRYHTIGELNSSDTLSYPADLYGIDPSANLDVFKVNLVEGEFLDPTDNSTILVERTFAEQHGISIGSQFTLSVFGETVDVEVAGFVLSIEHMMPHRNPKQLIYAPSRTTFQTVAPIWLHLGLLQNLAYTGIGEVDVVNEILVRFEPNQDTASLTHSILTEIEPYPILTTLETADLRGSELTRFDVAGDFIGLLAGMMLAVSSFVVYTTVKRIIESNSRSIGITRSIGYSTTEIQKSYLFLFGISSIITTVIAIPLGLLGGQAIIQFALEAYAAIVVHSFLPFEVYIIALIAGPSSVLISSYFPTRKISGYEPVRAIRGWMMEKGYVGETFLEKVGRKIGVGGYGFKYIVRSMSLNKTRVALMVIGIALAAGVASMGTAMVGGFNNSIANYMNEYEHWELLVDFKHPMNSTQVDPLIEQVEGVSDYEYYLKMGTSTVIDGTTRFASLLCLDMSGSLHEFNIETGRTIENPREVVIDVNVAITLNVELLETLNLTIGDEAEIFTIVGLVSSPMNVIYLELDEVTELLGFEMTSGLFVKVSEGWNPDNVADSVFSMDDVESVMTKYEASSGVISEVQGIAIAVGIAALALSIMLAVVWNMVSISTSERIPELAQLEAIGWSRHSLARLLVLEVVIVAILGVLISIPLGPMITMSFDGFMRTYIPFYRQSFDLVLILVLGVMTLITAIIATLPGIRQLRRIETDKVIRERINV